MELLTLVLSIALITLGAAVAVLHIVAPLTATDKDNKLLAILRTAEDILKKVVVPSKLR